MGVRGMRGIGLDGIPRLEGHAVGFHGVDPGDGGSDEAADHRRHVLLVTAVVVTDVQDERPGIPQDVDDLPEVIGHGVAIEAGDADVADLTPDGPVLHRAASHPLQRRVQVLRNELGIERVSVVKEPSRKVRIEQATPRRREVEVAVAGYGQHVAQNVADLVAPGCFGQRTIDGVYAVPVDPLLREVGIDGVHPPPGRLEVGDVGVAGGGRHQERVASPGGRQQRR